VDSLCRYEFQNGPGAGNLPHVHGLVFCDRIGKERDDYFANKITCRRDDLVSGHYKCDYDSMLKKGDNFNIDFKTMHFDRFNKIEQISSFALVDNSESACPLESSPVLSFDYLSYAADLSLSK
jgi:hypothetical protein